MKPCAPTACAADLNISNCRTRVQEFQIEKRHSCGEFDPRAPPSISTVASRSLVLEFEVFFEIKHGKLASKSRLSGSAKNISWPLEESTCMSVCARASGKRHSTRFCAFQCRSRLAMSAGLK